MSASQQMTVRADEVRIGDQAWLPLGALKMGWQRITKLELEGNDDVVFNDTTTTSIGNPVVVTRRVR